MHDARAIVAHHCGAQVKIRLSETTSFFFGVLLFRSDGPEGYVIRFEQRLMRGRHFKLNPSGRGSRREEAIVTPYS